MRIAVLDDDPGDIAFVSQTLAAGGHTCHYFLRGTSLKRRLLRETFDLLVLDWNVPNLSGKQLLDWVRTRKSLHDIPVVFLTCRADEADVAEILNAGADDYVVKPVPGAVLLAKINAVLRRAYTLESRSAHHQFGQYRFDMVTHQAYVGDRPVSLTAKEFGLAVLLFQNLDRALSRNYIVDKIWHRELELDTRTVDTHMSLVRTKLELRPENGYRLSSIYAYGYRLERVERVEKHFRVPDCRKRREDADRHNHSSGDGNCGACQDSSDP